MTAQECQSRDSRTVQRISTLLRIDPEISKQAGDLTVRVVESRIIVEGTVDTPSNRDRILPLIRQAGVLAQVQNDVRVA